MKIILTNLKLFKTAGIAFKLVDGHLTSEYVTQEELHRFLTANDLWLRNNKIVKNNDWLEVECGFITEDPFVLSLKKPTVYSNNTIH